MTEPTPATSSAVRLLGIVWPAFLLAGVQTMLVFALIDPEDLHWAGAPLPLSRTGICSLGFLIFWLLMITASALSMLLSRPVAADPATAATAEATPSEVA